MKRSQQRQAKQEFKGAKSDQDEKNNEEMQELRLSTPSG
jgi:hypothetical protein